MVIPMSEPPHFKGSVPIRIQDRDVAIATTKPVNTSIRNLLRCRILEFEHNAASPFVSIRLKCGTENFSATITRASMQELGLQESARGLCIDQKRDSRSVIHAANRLHNLRPSFQSLSVLD